MRKILMLCAAIAATAYGADLSKCDMCHKPTGKPAPAIPGGLYASPHAGLGCLSCHLGASEPHRDGVATRVCSACHTVEGKDLASSAHNARVKGTPKCYTCHGAGHNVVYLSGPAFQPPYARKVCAGCHPDITADYLRTAHGKAAREGDARAPACYLCHGAAHSVEAVATDTNFAPENLPSFCAGCHAGKRPTAELPFRIPDPRVQLLASVHGQVNEETGALNASCPDCHPPHREEASWNPDSSTHFMHVAKTCGKCHPKEFELFSISVHGLAAAAGMHDAPTCPDCHGDHNVVAVEPVEEGKRTRIVATCSSCHFSLALSAKFDIPNDRVQTFETSYHGVVSEGGKTTAADCGSCHGFHDVLPASDPRSSVNPANLEDTCGACHIRVTERFAGTEVHRALERPRRTPGDYVAIIYIIMIVVVVGGMIGHNVVDYVAKIREIRRAQFERSKVVVRLRRIERIQHIVLIMSFATLAFTGFSIKFPSAFLFSWIVKLEGPYPFRVTLHKIFAVVLIVASLYHIGYLLFTKNGRARLRAITPSFSDFRQGVLAILHAVGLVKERPEFGEFNYAEKAEYWALVWGNIIMALTGLYLWLDPYIQKYFPYWLYEVLRTIHFYEAILAVTAIIVWHFYFVIFDPSIYPMNFAWLDGKVPEKVLLSERLRYLKKIRGKEKEKETESDKQGEG